MSIFYIKRYSSQDAIGDIVAGITVGLTVIPQALAYAGIAGLDPAVSMTQVEINQRDCSCGEVTIAFILNLNQILTIDAH